MPQLIPFFFNEEVIYVFFYLIVTVFILSHYILPWFIKLNTTRLFINSI